MRKKIDIQDLLVWAFRDHVEAGVADPPPDALSVYWAVMALPSAEAELIARHARTGIAPDWRPDGAPVEHLGEMRRQRAVYADWVMSMARLAIMLEGTLNEFDVTGPAANDAPWIITRFG